MLNYEAQIVFKKPSSTFSTDISIHIHKTCPWRHGLVVRAVACEARGPAFDSNTDQMALLLSILGY